MIILALARRYMKSVKSEIQRYIYLWERLLFPIKSSPHRIMLPNLFALDCNMNFLKYAYKPILYGRQFFLSSTFVNNSFNHLSFNSLTKKDCLFAFTDTKIKLFNVNLCKTISFFFLSFCYIKNDKMARYLL